MTRILYFAWVRDAVGMAEEVMTLADGVVTVDDLVDRLAVRHAVFADRSRLRVAVDQVMADFGTDISAASEIAFFPPVTGG